MPFLRIFIPGRAAHVMKLKAILCKCQQRSSLKKTMMGSMIGSYSGAEKAAIKKETVRKIHIEKESFIWGSSNRSHSMPSNPPLPTMLCQVQLLRFSFTWPWMPAMLFQLQGAPSGIEAYPKFGSQEWINIFLSFKLADAETRYVNSEREYLAVVHCLSEVK